MAGIIYADDDIQNGGLAQFFSNSSGDFARRFPAFARKLGAPDVADVVAAANRLLGDIDLDDRASRNRALDRVDDDELSDLDDRYYEIDADFNALIVAYVESHPARFLAEP